MLRRRSDTFNSKLTVGIILVIVIQLLAIYYFTGRSDTTENEEQITFLRNEIAKVSSINRDLIEEKKRKHFLDDQEYELFLAWQRTLKNHATKQSPLPSPFFFVHIAKTGGTSLINIFKRSSLLLHQYWVPPSKEEAKNLVRSMDLNANYPHVISGHMCWGAHRWWDQDEKLKLSQYTYFTILREPIDRVFSHYRYHLRETDPNHWRVEDKTFTEWVQSIKFGYNVMTAYMAGIEHYAWWNENDFTLLPRAKEDSPDEFVITETHYRRARQNLIRSVIGFQEKYEEALDTFSTIFGVKLHREQKDNVGSVEYEPTEQELSIATMMNHWDIQLYDFAKFLYEEQQNILNYNN